MYRNTYAQIDVGNLQNNVKEIVRKYPEYDYYFAVVKGNAYGHSDKICKYLIECGINYFAISSLEEAISLRRDGIKTPILCLEPIDLKYTNMLFNKSQYNQMRSRLSEDTNINYWGNENV